MHLCVCFTAYDPEESGYDHACSLPGAFTIYDCYALDNALYLDEEIP
jgi:hypothetical protein